MYKYTLTEIVWTCNVWYISKKRDKMLYRHVSRAQHYIYERGLRDVYVRTGQRWHMNTSGTHSTKQALKDLAS
jgi:hypothetical protein